MRLLLSVCGGSHPLSGWVSCTDTHSNVTFACPLLTHKLLVGSSSIPARALRTPADIKAPYPSSVPSSHPVLPQEPVSPLYPTPAAMGAIPPYLVGFPKRS